MLTAEILDDEFSRGYRGRLRVLNQYSSVLKFMGDLRKIVHPLEMPSNECPAAATLALAAGIPLEQFVRLHSLLPFHRTVTLKDADVVHGDPSRLELIEHYGTRVWRQTKAMFCPNCIKEDLGSRPFSYWRRSLQLPGIHWCNKHQCQLANNPIGKKAFDGMPYPEMDAHYEFSEQEFSEVLANPVIQRYVEIAHALLDSERPTPLIHARFRIAEQAKKHQIRVGARGQLPTLTDKLLERVPLYWLKTMYPEIAQRSAGEFFSSIDNITLGLATDQSYVLALAVFFDSSERALDYWYVDIEGLPTERKAQRSFGKDYWSSDMMFRLYVEHCGNHTSMGQALGIDPTYARLELNAAGFPALGAAGRGSAVKAALDFHAGMSFDTACQSNGADREEVERLIRTGISKFAKALSKMR